MYLNDINAAARQHRQDLLNEAARDRKAKAARTGRRPRASLGARALATVAAPVASVLGAAEERLTAFVVARRQEA